MKKIFITALFLFPVGVFAQAGFVESPLWIVPEKPIEGESVSLFAALRNEGLTSSIESVSFYDGDTLLGTKEVRLAPGAVSSVAVSFRAQAGTRKFSAEVIGSDGIVQKESLSRSVEPKGLDISAQALGSGSLSDGDPILNKVADIEDALLSVFPDDTEDKIRSAMSSVEPWRIQTADKFKEKKHDSNEGSAGRILYGIGATAFSSVFVFYIGGLVLLLVILRFIFKKIIGLFRRH